MKSRASTIAVIAMLGLTTQPASSAEWVGYNSVEVPANSDVLVSVPFNQTLVSTHTVDTKTAGGVTVTDTLTVNAFANTFLVRFTSGNGKGLWSTISSNTANELVFQNTAILADVSVGDTFSVYPHQTLATVFPDGLQGKSFLKSASLASRSTEILVPNTTSVGINKSASNTYYFFNNEWRRVGSAPTQNFNNTVLSPEGYFVLRNNSTSVLKFITLGSVLRTELARFVPTESAQNDVPAVSGRPRKMRLAELGLGGTPAFATTTSLASRKDELQVFDNSAAGINKSAAATYFYFNNAWRKIGASPATSFNNELIDVGAAMVIRKASGVVGTAKWTQPPLF